VAHVISLPHKPLQRTTEHPTCKADHDSWLLQTCSMLTPSPKSNSAANILKSDNIADTTPLNAIQRPRGRKGVLWIPYSFELRDYWSSRSERSAGDGARSYSFAGSRTASDDGAPMVCSKLKEIWEQFLTADKALADADGRDYSAAAFSTLWENKDLDCGVVSMLHYPPPRQSRSIYNLGNISTRGM
jgi:hypothetical protein